MVLTIEKDVDLMKLSLLGVMGSVAGGSSDLGKNTTCLLIEDGDNKIVLDSGTGILQYFNSIDQFEHHILFTHYHLDHIIGLPYIKQLYDSNQTFHMYGPQLYKYNTLTMIPDFFREPFLPIDISKIKSKIHHNVLSENTSYQINNFTVKTMIVDHPGKCMVYSIHRYNKKITVLTDMPNITTDLDNLIQFSENSDIIYIDGYVTDEELLSYKHYGHCTIENTISFFNKTHSKQLIISHHKYDRLLKSIINYESKNIRIAREGDTYSI